MLPSQAPLAHFIHHNTLHAFQDKPFHEAVHFASSLFGARGYLPMQEYRLRYKSGEILPEALLRVISLTAPEESVSALLDELQNAKFSEDISARIGRVRGLRHFNLDKRVHPLLFRLTGAFLDQGLAKKQFPEPDRSFFAAIKKLDHFSLFPLFKSKRVRLLLAENASLETLLTLVAGNQAVWEHYLFDQQFAHPGWSGMVSVLEDHPSLLLHHRKITLEEFIRLELLLEADQLDRAFGENGWKPVSSFINGQVPVLFEDVKPDRYFFLLKIWQEALEWSFYDSVLRGITQAKRNLPPVPSYRFQAICCIDDRTAAFRRHLEQITGACQTFGAAGFFNIATAFQPEDGRYLTKVCPAPVTPAHVVRETGAGKRHDKVSHFELTATGLLREWLLSQWSGFTAAFHMALSIFSPRDNDFAVSSFSHMDPKGKLIYERSGEAHYQGLHAGFTVTEMADRVEGLLKSIGLTTSFAPLVYVIGHGASSVNNTHYAGYDCGACSGRPGSVNARLAALMANHKEVRKLLSERGIQIPEDCYFIGALHDTTRDEIVFYDLEMLPAAHQSIHKTNEGDFQKALTNNARERARRFQHIDNRAPAAQVHTQVKKRAVSLFEPRPEWNHATNAICIVGRRSVNMQLFMDRRAFLNSYDYRLDPDGVYLAGILNAVTPVCGGINLEYYFSRVDNERYGAGTKLPHNVMGLIGVLNGMDGDLRTGLPEQMISIHDPLRLLMIVEQKPQVILNVLSRNNATLEWYRNGWVHLVANDPESGMLYRYQDGAFVFYEPVVQTVPVVDNTNVLINGNRGNLKVHVIRKEAV